MKSTHWLMLVVLAAMIGAAGCGQSGGHGVMAYPIDPAAFAEKGMDVRWHTEVTLPTDPALTKFWLVDPYLVFCDTDNRVYVIDAATGVRRYTRVVAEKDQVVWGPSTFKDTLYVPTTTTMWAFEGPDGRDGGHKKIEYSPCGASVSNGYHVFYPGTRGWLQAMGVNARDPVKWTYWAAGPITAAGASSSSITEAQWENFDPMAFNYNIKGATAKDAKGWRGIDWGRWTEDAMTSRPLLDGTQVYFAGHDGIVYASQQNIRRINWEYKTHGPIIADLGHTKSGLVLAPSLDYQLYALGAGGREAWIYHAGEPLRKKAYSTGNQVFVFSEEAGLTVLDVATGKPKWALKEGAEFVSSNPDTLYILDRGRNLVALARLDGKVRWAMSLPSWALYVPNESDNGYIYLCSPGGMMMAVARKGQPETTPLPVGGKPAPGPEPISAPAGIR